MNVCQSIRNLENFVYENF